MLNNIHITINTYIHKSLLKGYMGGGGSVSISF